MQKEMDNVMEAFKLSVLLEIFAKVREQRLNFSINPIKNILTSPFDACLGLERRGGQQED